MRLIEPEGWAGRVHVLDAQGNPVPYARLVVALACETTYEVVDNGTQCGTLYTDRTGTATLRRLPRGEAKVTATFGATREASGTLRPGDGVLVLRLNAAR